MGAAPVAAAASIRADSAVPLLHGAVALVRKIRFFKTRCASESKFHVTVGHATVLATAVFFGARELAARGRCDGGSGASSTSGGAAGVAAAPVAVPAAGAPPAAAAVASDPFAPPPHEFDWSQQHEWQDELLGPFKRPPPAAGTGGASSPETPPPPLSDWQWCALLFESPALCPARCRVIASHLDADVHAATCRLAFEGRVVEPLASADVHELHRLNLIKVRLREREGVGLPAPVQATQPYLCRLRLSRACVIA